MPTIGQPNRANIKVIRKMQRTVVDCQYAALKSPTPEFLTYCKSSERGALAVLCHDALDTQAVEYCAAQTMQTFAHLLFDPSPRTSGYAGLRSSPPRRRLAADECMRAMIDDKEMPRDWVILFVDADNCLVAGCGKFQFYAHNVVGRVTSSGSAFSASYSLGYDVPVSFLLTYESGFSRADVEQVLAASHRVHAQCDSLAESVVELVVQDENFCVLSLMARKIDELKASSELLNSPRQSALKVLDSMSHRIPRVRRCIRGALFGASQSDSDSDECDSMSSARSRSNTGDSSVMSVDA